MQLLGSHPWKFRFNRPGLRTQKLHLNKGGDCDAVGQRTTLWEPPLQAYSFTNPHCMLLAHWSLFICISNKLPSDAGDAAGLQWAVLNSVLIMFSIFCILWRFDILKSLLARERLLPPGLAVLWESKRLSGEHAFHTHSSQSKPIFLNHHLYLIHARGANLSPALNYPKARFQATRDHV